MSEEIMTPAEILENHGRSSATPAVPTILAWYHGLPATARRSLSLEHLHRLAKMLRETPPADPGIPVYRTKGDT